MIYVKLPSGDEIYRGTKRSEHPNWNGWEIIDEARKHYNELSKEELIEVMLLSHIEEDEMLNVVYSKMEAK